MDRFARQRLVPGWDQDRLGRSRVIVCGIGALGNEVARLLALAGVGHLLLCDPDVVAESNLSRTPLFRPADVGRPKAEAAVPELLALNPGIRVAPRTAALAEGVGLAELRDADLVVSCLDSVAARVQLASRCNQVGVDLLDGGTNAWGGEVRYYRTGEDCYGCALTPGRRAVEDDPWSCGAAARTTVAGATAPVSALIGSWMAATAVRLLLLLETEPGILRVDAAGRQAGPVSVRRDPDCPLHRRIPPGAVQRVALTHRATVAELLAATAPGETVLAWAPVRIPGQRAADATAGSTKLADAPPQARLADVAVAPREILPVIGRGPDGARTVRYLELSGEEEEASR
ncbi:ThiF family adenylyltransferase [Kitasatospora sp. NPDC047058]|uniref:HesA/MoeB/ThiF family protein n=1 Tax=Kitasatospora sp. NPDC047058 TaxID=3155620 RepID=UPI0033CB18E0